MTRKQKNYGENSLSKTSMENEAIKIEFPFQPVAKGRPRMCRTGRVYTPTKTRKAEEDIKLWAMKYCPKKPLLGPLAVEIEFYVKRPNKPKCLYPITRPDTDNYVKLVLDSLNGILWEDDSQIVEIRAMKSYPTKNEYMGISLRVECL